MEDKWLVLKCKHGNRDALRQIYEKYKDSLLIATIALLNDVNAAEDVVHDVFVKFAGTVKGFELTGSLKAYLATCAVNLARNRIRTKQYQTVNLDQHETILSDFNDPTKAIICNEQLQQLSSALVKLSQEQREVIMLHIYYQIPLKTIAKSQSISINTVKSRYRYGIDRLRSILKSKAEK